MVAAVVGPAVELLLLLPTLLLPSLLLVPLLHALQRPPIGAAKSGGRVA